MKIGRNDVIILCGGELDDDARGGLETELAQAYNLNLAAVITETDNGGVVGVSSLDENGSLAYHLIHHDPDSES